MEDVNQLTPAGPMMIPFHAAVDYKIRHIPIKRCFDLVFSFLCLVIGAPVFLLIAGLIYLSSPGQVILSPMNGSAAGENPSAAINFAPCTPMQIKDWPNYWHGTAT